MPYKTFGTEVLTSSDVNTYLMRQAFIVCTSATRPPPVTGMHIWETDTQRSYVYDGGAWRFKEAPVTSLFVRKTVDEIVNNSSTPQDDDQLTVTVPPNSSWSLEAFIIYNSSTTADFSFHTETTTGILGAWGPNRDQTNKDSVLLNIHPFVFPEPIAGFGSDACVRLRGDLFTIPQSDPVTVVLKWAQATAEASNTTVRAGSYLYLRLLDV